MVIGIDFDGTCVSHEFPEIGKDIGAIPVLKELVAKGHQLVLFTMRSNRKGDIVMKGGKEIHPISSDYLDYAVNWFKENDIELYGIQENPTQKSWTSSPKAYCHLYIDDAALGCPLIRDSYAKRPYVDWVSVRNILVQQGLLDE